GLVTLLLIERAVGEWQNFVGTEQSTAGPTLPLSTTGLFAITLLAAAPSFIFWSRQGIFVTNLTQPLVFAMLWQGIRWLRTAAPRSLLLTAFFAGSALYAKLLALWVVGPFAVLLVGWYEMRELRSAEQGALSPRLLLGALLLFLVPLLPLIWFNLASGGTMQAIAGNLGTSYYGVDNLAIGANLAVRVQQFRQMITGEHFWYLGGLYGNPVAWWGTFTLLLAGILLAIGNRRYRARLLAPLLLLVMAFGASLFTLSDLFITHYALLQPLTLAVTAIMLRALLPPSARNTYRTVIPLVVLWVLLDLTATVRYHGALTASGGLADHSDATYHLAYHLQYNGLGAPLALDWGFDAPIRYLSKGTVTPIELFGYASPQQPDSAFADRLQPFLANPANVYLLHTPEATVFAGRRELFLALVAAMGRQAVVEQRFAQRDGTPLYELWRVTE
ncbi:MAG TPA: hypothetical protein P5121_28985, partial [Caldilineaceae bacterium]|nr:hypothetical protein [Caldilineaceae bacterium]